MNTSTDEAIAAIEARLAKLQGPARTGTLVELGQAQMSRSWEARIGSPDARALLDAAIAALDEACRYLDLGDPMRGRVASMAGWLYGIRHGVYDSSEHDRDTAIHLLTEALAFPTLPPALGAACQLILGQMYLSRVTKSLGPESMRAAMLGNTTPASAVDADRAVECFRAVLTGGTLSAEMSGAAHAMLQMAEALQVMLSGFGHGAGGFDLSRGVQAFTTLQKLQEQFTRPGGQGYGRLFQAPGQGGPPVAPFVGIDILVNLDAMDRPVTVLHGEEPPARAVPDTPVTVTAPVAPDVEQARLALRAKLTDLAKVPDANAAATELLRPDIASLPVDVVDECVALAITIVHSGQAIAPVLAGTDRYLLAVALFLRGTVAGGDRAGGEAWVGDGRDTDLRAGAEHLLAAAETLPPEHPITVTALLGLGAFVDERRPLGGTLRELTDRFQARAETVVAIGAVPRADLPVVHALRCLCAVVAAPGRDDVRELERAVAAIPAAYVWRTRLRAAAGIAVLAWAVAQDDLDGVRRATALIEGPGWLDGFHAVLDALLDDSSNALRAATARVVAESDAGTPEVQALVGALYLRLAGDTTGSGSELATAISALTVATRGLTDGDDPELRTGAWWRLAEAYRRRNGTGDTEAAHACAAQALRGPAPEASAPSRYASLMLADGRALDGFRALEAAAEARTRTVPALVADTVRVLGGHCPAPGALPPTVADVATAVRAVGADALLYLHPVDGPGESVAGVLLDPATKRVELAATVSDALDDPSWTAFAGWLSARLGADTEPRRVLVAPSGTGHRIPVAAAPLSNGGRLTDALVLSYVRSGGAVVELSRHVPRPVADDPVFVVNPRGDREAATFDALVLRRMVYPRSVGLGRVVEDVHGIGTPAEVLAHTGASMFHLACGLRTAEPAALELVDAGGPVTLDVAVIAARVRSHSDGERGGLVILPPDVAYDWDRSLTDTLLSCGFTGVVGWLWPVPDQVAALMLFVLHTYLVDDEAGPAVAVRAVHRWMRAPVGVPDLPPTYAATLGGIAAADPRYWAALCHWGR